MDNYLRKLGDEDKDEGGEVDSEEPRIVVCVVRRREEPGLGVSISDVESGAPWSRTTVSARRTATSSLAYSARHHQSAPKESSRRRPRRAVQTGTVCPSPSGT